MYEVLPHARDARRTSARFAIFLCLIGALGIGLIALRRSAIQKLAVSDTAPTVRVLPRQPGAGLTAQDKDADGLKDWEEAIYGTDPNNPDTDGDNTPDGAEVTGSRDPLKPWPNDKIVISDTTNAASTTKKEQNLTNDIGTLIVRGYLAKKQQNSGAIDPTQFTDDMLKAYLGDHPALPTPVINPQNIKTGADNSPEAVKKYFNALGQIIIRNLGASDHPLLLLTNIKQPEDFAKELPKLDPFIAHFQDAGDEMARLAVPSAWKTYHEHAMNIALAQTALLKELRKSAQDVIRYFLAIQQYQQTIADMQTLGNDIKAELFKRGIRFANGEPAQTAFGF